MNLRESVCNGTTAAQRQRHFQPRGLAVTADSTQLYVTRFLSFVRDRRHAGHRHRQGRPGLPHQH